ncbi:glycoside hydrolase family 97 catalytic domain-containing protein [Akkermansia sp. N21169]|uniref:glycoside hydrolase family 97 protein n=1 Tax=Akkermansia sp. N21169 TaxID=3040765 RepID=UPI00244EAB21|nr:glycoside hydrolase family 97 protein [Akkermansia sp. N21169]MDH3067570.1 glycoside hydrolase family 97 catalytic domain-containing protein [Akkermansia sp. N21169]
MKSFPITSLILPLVCLSLQTYASPSYQLKSPNEQLTCQIRQTPQGNVTYTLSYQGTPLIAESPMGYTTKDGTQVPGSGWHISTPQHKSYRGFWKPVWGKRSLVPERYEEVILPLESPESGTQQTFPANIDIVVRLYDDGLAFRYNIHHTENNTRPFEKESTEFRFAGDYTAWFYNGENANIGPEKLSVCHAVRLPVMTIDTGTGHFMAIHEADLRTGEPMKLQSEEGSCDFTIPSRPGMLNSDTPSPWRVVFCGETPGVAIDSHLLELLNPPPDPSLDFSWVRPGVCVWDWRINGAKTDGFTYHMDYPSWVRMVDFASDHNIKHLVLDANWYGPEFQKDSNPLQGGKTEDVQKIIQYGKQKNVGVWLYLNDVGGRQYPLDKTLEQYARWGAAGVKYGFMNGTPEEKNARTRRITELCARNHLLIDFHDGPVHPYGQMRTWPNAITREYCQAQLDGHKVFPPATFLTSVFVNMVAGPLDMNNGMFDLRQGPTTRTDENKPVPSTLVSEAARTLIVFSGATILPDIPEYYTRYPSLLEFISAQQMPWVESKTLDGKIGEYIVMARQTPQATLIAAAGNESPRDLIISLSFLKPGSYQATITQDGPEAHYLHNRETLTTETRTVTPQDSIPIHLAPGGGACILLKLLEK